MTVKKNQTNSQPLAAYHEIKINLHVEALMTEANVSFLNIFHYFGIVTIFLGHNTGS